jgi:two-component system response regulator YesN
MLKVFLVEDEFVVREGIKKNIDWQTHGYEFCGEASDGELAFPMIQKLRPDIVITDIKMPFMDGLVLSRLIKKELPATEIIILTGYEEFEYAKEAIKIGISRYLLKPISGDDLLKEVDALAVKIEENHKEQEIRDKYLSEMKENILKERKDLFQYLVSGTKTVEELLEMADKLGIDLSSIWYNVALLKIKSLNHAHDEYSNSLIEIEEKMNMSEEDNGPIVFDRNLEGKALLFRADTKEKLEELQRDYIQKLKSTLAEYEDVIYFVGIGMAVNRLREIPTSFEAASHAFAHRYLVGDSCVLDSAELEKGVYMETEDFNIKEVDPKQLDRGKIREFLKFGDRDETIYFVEEFFKAIGANVMKSNIFRQYITMDIYFCVAEFVEGLQVKKEDAELPDAGIFVVQSEENAVKYTVALLDRALEIRETAADNKYGSIVDKMIEYIEENYADEELSLNLIASHINFSPNHLSTIFARQTGQTFIKYLTEYRMNKAKELLRCTGKRSSEISVEVGYRDSHYFSYLFKKTQGMTPTQYRGQKSPDGEE